MMDTTMILIRIGIVAVTLTAGVAAVVAGMRRLRWVETHREHAAMIDPVLNLCVRGMAVVLLLAMIAWLAVGASPAGKAPCQCLEGADGQGMRTCERDGADIASAHHDRS